MMTRKVQTLASGSSGNATFVQLGETRFLVDAGISLTRIEKALTGLGESIDQLSAVLLTHEHGDHVAGLDRLLKKRPDLPVLATAGTLQALKLRRIDARRLKPGKPHHWANLDIVPFQVSHDAEEPVGLRIEAGAFAMGFCTDLGFWTDEVVDAIRGCPFLLVEANHDPDMLRRGPYPRFLKRRVSGRRGHLANAQAQQLFERVADPCIETVVLAHLSETNNTTDLAHAAAHNVFADEVNIVVAGPNPGPLLDLEGEAVFDGPPRQLALF